MITGRVARKANAASPARAFDPVTLGCTSCRGRQKVVNAVSSGEMKEKYQFQRQN